ITTTIVVCRLRYRQLIEEPAGADMTVAVYDTSHFQPVVAGRELRIDKQQLRGHITKHPILFDPCLRVISSVDKKDALVGISHVKLKQYASDASAFVGRHLGVFGVGGLIEEVCE